MAISSAGIGSGLDVNGLIYQLMAAERMPIESLKTRQSSFNAKLSAFGTLKSNISTFETALKALNNTSTTTSTSSTTTTGTAGTTTTSNTGLTARTATVSKPEILGATASSDASPGTYAIEVVKLAQQHKLNSGGVEDAAKLMGTGGMTIQVGTNAAVTIPSGDYSLNSLSKAINAAKAGVTATVINDGSTDRFPNRLVITANDSGAANKVTISASGGLAQFAFDPASPPAPGTGMSQNQAAQNAELVIDNLPISKASNTITDAITGVTLNLTQTNAGSTVNLAVANDTAAGKAAVTSFVDAYNKLSSSIKTMTAYNATTKTGGVLNGESGAASIVTALRKELTTPMAGGGAFTTLSDIGVAFQADGSLKIDDTKLKKALDANFNDVTALFSATDGFATRLLAKTKDMLGTDGVITSRTEGLNSSIKQLTRRQEEIETRLIQVEKRYRTQFTALDSMINSMQSTSSFLSQQLASLMY